MRQMGKEPTSSDVSPQKIHRAKVKWSKFQIITLTLLSIILFSILATTYLLWKFFVDGENVMSNLYAVLNAFL